MDKFVITIGRQYGSGGREIAKKIAERFNVKCYDKEIISLASQNSGLCEDFISSCDERAMSNVSFAVSGSFYFSGSGAHHIQTKAYLAQFSVIKELAEKESCVIVGRVADYVLKNKENKISIFITSDFEDRVKRVMENDDISEKQAEKIIKKADKDRAKYYNFFSQNVWGSATAYDICVNASILGIEETADFLIKFIEKRLAIK